MAKSLYDGRLQRHRPLFIYYAGLYPRFLPSSLFPPFAPCFLRSSRRKVTFLLRLGLYPGETNLICVVDRGRFVPLRGCEYGKFHLRSRVRLKLHTDGFRFYRGGQMNEIIEERHVKRCTRRLSRIGSLECAIRWSICVKCETGNSQSSWRK